MSHIAATPRSGVDPQPRLRSLVKPYESPSISKSLFQIATSIGLFMAACAVMYWSLHVSYLLTLAFAVPTAGLLVRVFIVQHDCGHGAFFRSRWTNDLVGRFCSLLTVTPYAQWRRQHNDHHGNWSNLDRRLVGLDMYSTCTTVDEYRALSRWGRIKFRATHHPLVAHVIIPPLVFLFLYRVPFDTPKSWIRERRSVYLTNLGVLALLAALMSLLGVWQVLLVQVPVIMLTAIIGAGLFSLQHRFDGVVWARQDEWNVTKASLEGSSYFKLPRMLQWFTGNIGFHHIHHLSPRVPNYRLEDCHNAIPAFKEIRPLNWRDGLKAISLALWDETSRRMVRFAEVRSGRKSPIPVATQ